LVEEMGAAGAPSRLDECAEAPRGVDGPLRSGPPMAHLGGMTRAEDPHSSANPAQPDARKPLTPEAERALAEAAERRAKQQAEEAKVKEVGGPGGPEPTRYGDWEKKGLTSDF
jgi:hypothetical protein